MPQTTGAMSQAGHNSVIEINLNKTSPSWQDVSGSASSFAVGEISFMTGEAYTFDGRTAIVTVGKQEPVEVTVDGIYTSVSQEVWHQISTAKTSADGYCQVRHFPKGKTHGSPVFTTDATYSFVSSITPPTFNASEAAPVPAGFTVITSDVVVATYTTGT